MTKKITITDLADVRVGGWEKTPTIPLEEA